MREYGRIEMDLLRNLFYGMEQNPQTLDEVGCGNRKDECISSDTKQIFSFQFQSREIRWLLPEGMAIN